jgi:hypothetical protein
LLQKIYWNKHKYDSSAIELKSFDAMLNYCLFSTENSRVFILNNNKNLYFSPLPLDYKLVIKYKSYLLEVDTTTRLLFESEFDPLIVFLSYFKNILNIEELSYLISFTDKIRFWKKSKSRFINHITMDNNTITIDFKLLSTKVENIIFN